MNLIILAGMPASGKSTIAKVISDRLNLPILEKDVIKESLFDTLGFSNYGQKRKLDHAANLVLLTCAEALMRNGQSMILDNNFDEQSSKVLNCLIKKYSCNCVTIFFGGDIDAFYQRYTARDNAHERHLGHVLQEHYPPLPGESHDYTMTREEFTEKFEKRGMAQFRCDGARIDIDATDPGKIDIVALIEQICLLL
jgi:predicted kinase